MRKVLKIALIGVMAALAIVLNLLKINITVNLRVTFYALPLLFAGMAFDKYSALATGLIAGLIEQIQWGIMITTPFWLLAPIAWSLVSHFLFKAFKFKNELLNILIVVVLTSLSATILNTGAMFIDSLLIQDSWYTVSSILVDLPLRLVVMAIMIVPYTALLYALSKTALPLYKKL